MLMGDVDKRDEWPTLGLSRVVVGCNCVRPGKE